MREIPSTYDRYSKIIEEIDKELIRRSKITKKDKKRFVTSKK